MANEYMTLYALLLLVFIILCSATTCGGFTQSNILDTSVKNVVKLSAGT